MSNTGRPEATLPSVRGRVAKIVDKWDIRYFCVTRASDHANILTKCDNLVPIYQSDNVADAQIVEADLTKWFTRHWKWSKDSRDSVGSASGDHASVVYLMLWYAKQSGAR